MSAPSVTVIMPNYNHGHELRLSLPAVCGQTEAPAEVIVVDDGSHDDSVSIIEEMQRTWPMIRLLRNETNRGVAYSVNRALAEVKTPYVLCASADEMLMPGMIAALRPMLDAYPQAPLCVSGYSEWWPETGTIIDHGAESELGYWYLKPNPAPAYISPIRLRCLLRRAFVWLSATTALMRTEAWRQAGGYDASLAWHADWFALYAMALRGGFCVVPEVHARFRVSLHSFSGRGMRNAKLQSGVIMAILGKLASPSWRDVRDAMFASPAVFSPMMRSALLTLGRKPRYYRELLLILRWWGVQVLTGKRPRSLADLLAKIGLKG